MEGDLSELTRALLSGDRGALEKLLREAASREAGETPPENFRLTPYTRMASRLSLDRVQSEIERFKAMLQMLAEGGEDLRNVMRYLDGATARPQPPRPGDYSTGAEKAGD